MERRPALKWRRISLVGLLPALLALPARGQERGRLHVVLDGEAGARDDGSYGLQQGGQALQSQAVGRLGFDLQLSYALERLSLALGYSPYYERALNNKST